MKKLLAAAGLAGLLAIAGVAVAQSISVPFVASVNNNTDAIQIVTKGQPSAQSTFATPAQITNVPGYAKVNLVPSAPCVAQGQGCAGYYNSFAANQSYMVILLTGTLAYSYNYTASSPSDGARECIAGSGGAITQASLLATGSQVVTGGSNVSVTSNSSACWSYSASNLTWDRS